MKIKVDRRGKKHTKPLHSREERPYEERDPVEARVKIVSRAQKAQGSLGKKPGTTIDG